MAEYIEKQAAIDALGEKPLAWTEGEYELGLQNQWQSDVDALNGLPSAQPERKGKWVGVGYDGDWLKTMCKCSKCGAMIDINEKYRNFFCYHCGARMDGEQNE